MKTAYFDCFAGISGDMTIGALLNLGADFEVLKRELAKLGLSDYELSATPVFRAQIACTKFDVRLGGKLQTPPVIVSHQGADHHDHAHAHDGVHAPKSHVHAHRGVLEIHAMIDAAGFSSWVTERAKRIFWRLAQAEGAVHGVAPEKVHFHEVGAADAIIDIVGACVGFELLGVERFVASPLHVGFGFVECAHGRYPIPPPGTSELLKGLPTYATDLEGEFVTPTGAAIVATLCTEFTRSPNLSVERIGYGAGGRDVIRFPNTLRILIGEDAARAQNEEFLETVATLETNLDDVSPQTLGYVMERLFAADALDVFFTPIQMKKNRPGVLLSVLCRPEARSTLLDILFRETTTLGVRTQEMQRRSLPRRSVDVETPFGAVRVKEALLPDGRRKATPEYDDCRALALADGTPLATVQAEAMKAYEKKQISNGK